MVRLKYKTLNYVTLYNLSLTLNNLVEKLVISDTTYRNKFTLRRSCFKLVSHIASSIATFYPNDSLKKLNYALYHLKEIRKSLISCFGKENIPIDLKNVILQIEKLIKVHMKNVWKI